MRSRDRGGARRRLLGAAGALLVGCLLVVALGTFLTGRWPASWPVSLHAAAADRPAASPVPSASPEPSPSPNETLKEAQAIVSAAAPPARLLVPSIKVDAAVEAVGQDAQGRMATPAQASDVAWYQLGAAPGAVGNAVIAGHLDWTNGPAVFWYLGKVRSGDHITVVRADGSHVDFITDSTYTVPYDSWTTSLAPPDGAPSLTLITCAGTWDTRRGTYLQRLVVHATLAPPVSSGQAGDEGG